MLQEDAQSSLARMVQAAQATGAIPIDDAYKALPKQ